MNNQTHSEQQHDERLEESRLRIRNATKRKQAKLISDNCPGITYEEAFAIVHEERASEYLHSMYPTHNQTHTRRTGMNLNTVALLINPNVTSCECVFLDEDGEAKSKPYTFAIQRGLCVVNDLAVVATQYGYKVVRIVDLHEEPRFDSEAGFDYNWVYARVNTAPVDHIRQQTEEVAAKLQQRKQASLRHQTLAALGITQEEVRELFAPAQQSSTTMTGPASPAFDDEDWQV